VYEDAKKADKYIQKLSGIYRYILENEEVDLVPLNKEIEFVKQYFDLQKVRDNEKIALEIDFQDADQFNVVPVSLQILVENALKHNSRSEKLPLKIRIERKNDEIVVSNIIQKKNILENASKTGLLNLKERVRLILDKDLILEEDNNQFIVKLPIIKLLR
jgi:two-component system LytT family sensor kinase